MALVPTQQFYLVLITPGNPYGPQLRQCTVTAVSADIVNPLYNVGDSLLCGDKAWVLLDSNGGQTNGCLVTSDQFVCKVTP